MPSVVGVIGDGSRWVAAMMMVMSVLVFVHGRRERIEIYQRRH